MRFSSANLMWREFDMLLARVYCLCCWLGSPTASAVWPARTNTTMPATSKHLRY